MSQQVENLGANGVSIPIADAQARADIVNINSSLAQKTGTLTLGNGTIILCQDRNITTAVVTASATTNLTQGTWTNADTLPSGLSKFDFLAISLSSGNLILRVSGSTVQYYWANSGTGVWLQGSGATTNSMA